MNQWFYFSHFLHYCWRLPFRSMGHSKATVSQMIHSNIGRNLWRLNPLVLCATLKLFSVWFSSQPLSIHCIFQDLEEKRALRVLYLHSFLTLTSFWSLSKTCASHFPSRREWWNYLELVWFSFYNFFRQGLILAFILGWMFSPEDIIIIFRVIVLLGFQLSILIRKI